MKRALIHVPVGVACGLLAAAHSSLPLVFGLGFLFYEGNQDRNKRDEAWRDVVGFLWGIPIGAAILYLIRRYHP